MYISLVERGPAEFVPLDDWRRHGLDAPMKFLAERGVIRIARTSVGFIISPSNFVGEMTLPTSHFEIRPKFAAVTKAMERVASDVAEKELHNLVAERALRGIKSDDPSGYFFEILARCIDDGFPWGYRAERAVTSFPRGRICFNDTVRVLASRGVHHKVVASLSQRRQHGVLIDVVNAVSRHLAGTRGYNARRAAEIERLILALEPSCIELNANEALAQALELQQVEANVFDQSAKDLLLCCIAILEMIDSLSGWVQHVPNGTARFRNMEAVWERCTHSFFQSWLANSGLSGIPALHGLRGKDFYLFDDGGPRIDPDVVVLKDEQYCAVVDAKYKELNSSDLGPSADLYQMTCYVRRLNASLGVLVYLTEEESSARIVGYTADRALIVLISISSSDLLDAGKDALAFVLHRFPRFSESFHDCFANGLSK